MCKDASALRNNTNFQVKRSKTARDMGENNAKIHIDACKDVMQMTSVGC